MKTVLPKQITTIKGAKLFLFNLWKNGEAYHPEDDAKDIIWEGMDPTEYEKETLNLLMDQIHDLEGDFDPCEFLLNIDK